MEQCEGNYTILFDENSLLRSRHIELINKYNETIDNPEIRYGEGGDCTLFITPEDETIITLTEYVLNETYDGALTIEDIDKINTWVATHIYYQEDPLYGVKNHSFQYPRETYLRNYGDCEDQATLMVSMCKAEENIPGIWCASVRFYKDGEYNYHICVFVKMKENQYCVFDPTFNSGWKSNISDMMYIALEEDYASSLDVHYVDVLYIFNENTYRRFKDILEFFDYF